MIARDSVFLALRAITAHLDKPGHSNLKPEQVTAFFRLVDQRYGRVSTIIATNLDYSAW